MKSENADHGLTKTLELQAYLELEGRNPIGTANGSSAGVNHMRNQFLTTLSFSTNLFARSKETPITCHTIETDDHAINLVAESEIETAPWIGEARMTHGKTQETDMETTHGITETHTCLRAIDKIIAMIHVRDMDKDTIPENVGLNNQKDRLHFSHFAMTGDKTART